MLSRIGHFVVLVVLAAPGVAQAGVVSGVLNLAPRVRDDGGYAPRASATRGFVEKQPTPLRAKLPVFNPYPYLVVVLDGASASRASAKGTPDLVEWKLIGARLGKPLQPVQVGQEVEIRNMSRNSQRLFCPNEANLLPAGPIDPGGRRPFRLKERHRTLEIRSHGAAHVFGRIVAFDHPYFSSVNNKGEFQIKNVPPGTWTLRVWYRDGWLADTTSVVEVLAARGNRRESITLPSKLTPKVPGQGK